MTDPWALPGKVIALFPEGSDAMSPDQNEVWRPSDGNLDKAVYPISPTEDRLNDDDAIGAAGAAIRALASLSGFVGDADGWLSVGLALDGMMPCDRSQQEQNLMNTVLRALAGHRMLEESAVIPKGVPVPVDDDIPPLSFDPPYVTVVKTISGTLEEGGGASSWQSMFLPKQVNLPVGAIVLCESIGFRDMQIAIQDEMARAFAAFAATAGVHIAPGDAGLRVACSMRRQADPVGGYGSISTQVAVTIDGMAFFGVCHSATQNPR